MDRGLRGVVCGQPPPSRFSERVAPVPVHAIAHRSSASSTLGTGVAVLGPEERLS